MRKYRVIWKGRGVATLSRGEIVSAFRRGAFGPLHSVDSGDGKLWDMEDFVNSAASGRESAESPASGSFDFETFGFILCGLSFLSPFVFAALCAYAFFLRRCGRGKRAAMFLAGGALAFLSGLIFYRYIFPSL